MFATATCARVVEEHALKLDDPAVLALVVHWYEATSALRAFMLEHAAAPLDPVKLDLVEVSTLAEMFLGALSTAPREDEVAA